MSSNPWQNPVNSGSMTPLCYVTMHHEKSVHVDFCGYPKQNRDLLTWSTHFRTDALTSKRSFKAVCSLQWLPKMIFVIHHFGPSNSGHFFWEKCSNFFKHLLGDTGYSPSFRWILGLRTSAGAVHLVFLAFKRSRLRGRIPHCTVDRRDFFQLKTLQNRLEMGSNQHSCDLFSKEIVQFCTGEGCPLPNTLVGTMLLFRFWDANPWFSDCTDSGASQGI